MFVIGHSSDLDWFAIVVSNDPAKILVKLVLPTHRDNRHPIFSCENYVIKKMRMGHLLRVLHTLDNFGAIVLQVTLRFTCS